MLAVEGADLTTSSPLANQFYLQLQNAPEQKYTNLIMTEKYKASRNLKLCSDWHQHCEQTQSLSVNLTSQFISHIERYLISDLVVS